MNGKSLSGKTCMVTGATSGIGKATALALAKLGAKVIIVARNPQRCEKTRDEINLVAQYPAEVLLCDFSSLKDVQRAAEYYLASGRALHILINNAGAVFQNRQETVDRIEATFGVNHLGPFQFTLRLLPLLRTHAPARIINVASEAHKLGGAIDFTDLELRQSYGPLKAYGRSKLANIFFTQGLAQQLSGCGVTVNAVHPGAVATNLGSNNNKVLAFIMRWLMRLFFKSPDKGAETSVYLATAPELEGISGRYFANCREKTVGKVAQNRQAVAQLWAVSEKMTGVSFA